jgi:hypothetical protein
MITWYAFTFPNQPLLGLNEIFHLEHIYSKKRQEMERGLKTENSLDSLGNKVLLESSINIKASDYRFEDKKTIYSGAQRRGNYKDPSKVSEISDLISYPEFEEKQVIERNNKILDRFFEFLQIEGLIA